MASKKLEDTSFPNKRVHWNRKTVWHHCRATKPQLQDHTAVTQNSVGRMRKQNCLRKVWQAY